MRDKRPTNENGIFHGESILHRSNGEMYYHIYLVNGQLFGYYQYYGGIYKIDLRYYAR